MQNSLFKKGMIFGFVVLISIMPFNTNARIVEKNIDENL